MSTTDKAREKLMSSMFKTKDGIKDSAGEAALSSAADSKAAESKKIEATKAPVAQETKEAAPVAPIKDAPKVAKETKKEEPRYFPSNRVWPD